MTRPGCRRCARPSAAWRTWQTSRSPLAVPVPVASLSPSTQQPPYVSHCDIRRFLSLQHPPSSTTLLLPSRPSSPLAPPSIPLPGLPRFPPSPLSDREEICLLPQPSLPPSLLPPSLKKPSPPFVFLLTSNVPAEIPRRPYSIGVCLQTARRGRCAAPVPLSGPTRARPQPPAHRPVLLHHRCPQVRIIPSKSFSLKQSTPRALNPPFLLLLFRPSDSFVPRSFFCPQLWLSSHGTLPCPSGTF